MIHYAAITIASFMLLSPVWASCQNKVFSLEVNYGVNSVTESVDAKGSTLTIPLPMMNEGAASCYQQSTPLMVKAENVRENEYVDFEIVPMDAKAVNVPKATMYEYIHIEQNDGDNNPRVLLINFLCSGEHPLAADAYADHLKNIAENKDASRDMEIYISTGEALGDYYSLSPKMKARSKIYDSFLDIFDDRNKGENSLDTSPVFIPNILSGLAGIRLTPMDKKLYSTFFARTGSSLNACHPHFIESMKDKLLESVVKSQPFTKIEIKKKFLSSKHKMKWEL